MITQLPDAALDRQPAGPVYRSIVAIDLEGSTMRTNKVKGELRRVMYDLLSRAFEATITESLEQVLDRWESRKASADQHFKDLLETSSLGTPAARRIRASTPAPVVAEVRRRQAQRNPTSVSPRLGEHLEPFTDQGDGVLVLVRPHDDVPKTVLVDRVIPQLTELLAEHNTAVTEPALQMRLRAVVHAGEVHADSRGFYGEAIDVAIRLLDSPLVKKELKQTTSPLVLVVSEEIYSAITSHSHSGAGAYQLLARVRVGRRQHRGWVHIPGPSDIVSVETIPTPRTRHSPAMTSSRSDGMVQGRQRARNAVTRAGLSGTDRHWNASGSGLRPAVEVELCG
jgi:hypothetical protein